jgi:hypothetical protein
MGDRRGPRTYLELKQEAEGAVVRWAWGTLFLYDSRPYFAQRWGFSVPKALKKPPANKKRAREYGFDGNGRLRVVRAPTEFDGKVGEEFFWYGEGWTKSQLYTHFDKNNGIRSEFRYEEGRIVEATQQTPHGPSVERYRYEHDRLVGVAFQGADGSKRSFEIEHHDDGSLAAVRENGIVIFEAAPPPLSNLLKRAGELIVERTVERVLAFGDSEAAYCLALVYSRDYYMLPPELGIGYDAQRAAWRAADPDSAVDHVWSPEEWRGFGADALRLDDPELAALGKAIGHRLRTEGSDQPALDLLVAVAKKLAKQDLGAQFVKTSDFVVCVLSLEEGLTAASLASMPAAARKKLIAQGMVPDSMS